MPGLIKPQSQGDNTWKHFSLGLSYGGCWLQPHTQTLCWEAGTQHGASAMPTEPELSPASQPL